MLDIYSTLKKNKTIKLVGKWKNKEIAMLTEVI